MRFILLYLIIFHRVNTLLRVFPRHLFGRISDFYHCQTLLNSQKNSRGSTAQIMGGLHIKMLIIILRVYVHSEFSFAHILLSSVQGQTRTGITLTLTPTSRISGSDQFEHRIKEADATQLLVGPWPVRPEFHTLVDPDQAEFAPEIRVACAVKYVLSEFVQHYCKPPFIYLMSTFSKGLIKILYLQVQFFNVILSLWK